MPLVAHALLACAAPAKGPADGSLPSPVLWRARSPELGTLYLLGSVHMGAEAAHTFGPQVAEAWKSSDELVVEVDTDRVSQSELVSLTRLYGTLPSPLSLRDVISGPTWGQLDAYFSMRGLDTASFAHLKPWFVAFTLVQLELQRAGYGVERGVDRAFLNAARGRKPVVELETVASQLQTMDRLPASLQELMLRDALARIEHLSEDTVELIDAWQRGDEGRLEALVFQPLLRYPELGVFYDLVYYRRNHTMAARLRDLSGDGRTRFVVIGAGHMLGDQGIPAILAGAGYDVRRVR